MQHHLFITVTVAMFFIVKKMQNGGQLLDSPGPYELATG